MSLFRKSTFITLTLLALLTSVSAQFAPAAGLPGSSAIYKDDLRFAEWATACAIQRGYQDIANPDSGYASLGDGSAAVGNAGTAGLVSLGDGGIATLTFPYPVYNGPGIDFAVFENGFSTSDSTLAFLEFAFVEVSSDGINFFRFPATSNTQDTLQIGLQEIDCSLVNNLAGKYVSGYGTPFDLEELRNEAGLDVNHITAIRIIDVVGSINNAYATYDQFGKKINDPYPTPFPSSGFDLDAVGIIHAVGLSAIVDSYRESYCLTISPNRARPGQTCLVKIDGDDLNGILNIYNVTGRLIMQEDNASTKFSIQTGPMEPGLYFVSLKSGRSTFIAKLLIE